MRPGFTRIYPRKIAALSLLAAGLGAIARPQPDQPQDGQLKTLSLEQLGNVEVTTMSKAPEQVWQTAAAVYVITQDDIRRSGATTIP